MTAGECCIVLVNGRGAAKQRKIVHIFSLCFPPPWEGKDYEKPVKSESQRSVNTWRSCWIQRKKILKITDEFSHAENLKLDLRLQLYTEAIDHLNLYNCLYPGFINSADELNDNLHPNARSLPVYYRFISHRCSPILITGRLPRFRQL